VTFEALTRTPAAGFAMAVPFDERLSRPALFVVSLSVLFLAFPCPYLYQALAERGVFRQFRAWVRATIPGRRDGPSSLPTTHPVFGHRDGPGVTRRRT